MARKIIDEWVEELMPELRLAGLRIALSYLKGAYHPCCYYDHDDVEHFDEQKAQDSMLRNIRALELEVQGLIQKLGGA